MQYSLVQLLQQYKHNNVLKLIMYRLNNTSHRLEKNKSNFTCSSQTLFTLKKFHDSRTTTCNFPEFSWTTAFHQVFPGPEISSFTLKDFPKLFSL